MILTGLFHIAVKTNDLEGTIAFYTKVLGLRLAPRPDFGFPGAWIAAPTPVGEAIIHLYAGGPALGPEEKAQLGTGAIDHVSLTAIGWDDCRARLSAHGLDWREFVVPGTTLWRIFVYDPNGVMLELTFDGRAEGPPAPGTPAERRYQAGVSFFEPRARV